MSVRKVPFFEYPRLWLDDREKFIEIIDQVASSGGFIMQEALQNFEINLAKYCGVNYSVGVGNATDAMEIYLNALNFDEGSEIIISTHTMLATASAIKVAGGVPVPVDIGADNLIDPVAVEEAINSRTVGIMPTQLNGRVCDMSALKTLADRHGLFIVEDAAQALGAKYCGQAAGTFGLASDISFFPAKVVGCLGDAGAILVNDKRLYEIVYEIHDHGRSPNNGAVNRWGRNSRLDNVQAAILDYKLGNYSTVIERRRHLASIYQSQLGGLQSVKLPPPPVVDEEHYDVYQNYEITAENRDALRKFLSEHGVGTLIQWGGLAIHQYKNLGFAQHCPTADEFFKTCLMLPMNNFVSDDDVHYVCDAIRAFYRV